MTLLLLLLLAISGRVLAAPCATETHGGQAATAAAMVAPQQAHAHQPADAAHQGHCAQQGDGAGGDCELSCICCPGHCATALPSAYAPSGVPAGVSPVTVYREDNSSPAPESAIRPPISR